VKDKFTVEENVALAPLTTLKIGGAARFFVRVDTEEGVARALDFAREKSLDVFVLGGGSNVVISDSGFNGLVLQMTLKGIDCADDSSATKADKLETVPVAAQAGEIWDDFVKFCVGKNLAGLECLSGIPGLVGATPIQNVGAYGQEVSETITSVRCFDRVERTIVELSNAECGFAYRTSIFNTTHRERYIVLSVTFALTKNGAPKIVYKDLHEYFADYKSAPNLAETREAILEIRRAKSMVIDERDENSRSVGSFFKNPIVTSEKYEQAQRRARRLNLLGDREALPKFAVDETHMKIPAAWLIGHSGFQKGYRKGNVGVSTKHNLAIINRGGAKAIEISSLKFEIQKAVRVKFDIELLPEPVFVGSF
jgi:UDP-N-acetylmuramate dehydrogenase